MPDIGVYRWTRIPRRPDGQIDDNHSIPAEIAIEIISPGQSIRALSEKCRWYVANGVEIALLVDDRGRA